MGDAAHRRGALRVCYAVFLNSKIVAERDCRVSYAYIARDMAFIERSVVIDGHKTSVSLEDAFWTDLKKIAHVQQVTLSELVTKIDGAREQSNLSSAIRLFVLHHFRNEEKRMDVTKAHFSTVAAERTPASKP